MEGTFSGWLVSNTPTKIKTTPKNTAIAEFGDESASISMKFTFLQTLQENFR
jgi:hypothetical protein